MSGPFDENKDWLKREAEQREFSKRARKEREEENFIQQYRHAMMAKAHHRDEPAPAAPAQLPRLLFALFLVCHTALMIWNLAVFYLK